MIKKYQHISTFLLITFSTLLFASCQKDLDNFIPDPGQPTGPDTTWYASLSSTMPVGELKNNLLLPLHTDSINLVPGAVTTLTASSGLTATLQGGSFVTLSQVPVSGTIDMESILLLKKGDLIRMGTPTVSDGRMLVSGGAFFLRFKKGQEELQFSQNGRININFQDQPLLQNMQLFNGSQTDPFNFNWIPNLDSANNSVFTTNQSYLVHTNQLQWINIDYFYDTTGIPMTRLAVSLPSNYTNANSMAYLVFNNMRSVLPLTGNITERKFISGLIPANMQVTVVVISKQSNNYFLGSGSLTTALPQGTSNWQETSVSPSIQTLDAIKNFLNSL